jgi:hypothetical protein
MSTEDEPYLRGVDTVVFSAISLKELLLNAIPRIAEIWPTLIADVDVDWSSNAPVGFKASAKLLNKEQILPFLDSLATYDFVLLAFVRDSDMWAHFEENSYALMGSGEGPVAVWFRKRGPICFSLLQLDEKYAADRSRPGAVDPYPAWLSSPSLNEFSVTTPGDPDVDPFSKRMLEIVLAACTGGAPGFALP